MAFRYNAFSEKLSKDPASAHRQLIELFEKHECSTTLVAKELDTTSVSLRRWIKRLTDQGYRDPGKNYRRTRGKGKTAAVR